MTTNTKAKGKKTFVKLGALIKNKDGGFYIAIDKEVNLSVNGKNFTGKYITCEAPKVKYDRMLNSGKITKDQYASKVEAIPDYVRQELTISFDT